MKQFFSMRKSEKLVLPFLIIFAVISFLPIWRTIEIGGMAVFGWLMAILMIVSPILTLLALRHSDKPAFNQPSPDETAAPGISGSKEIDVNNSKED